jgi:hypothetical protein
MADMVLSFGTDWEEIRLKKRIEIPKTLRNLFIVIHLARR